VAIFGDHNMGLTLIEKVIPGTRWLRGYTKKFAVADLIAGLTVSLTVLPQGLAYATLAGLEPQYGLYSAFMGGFIYAFIGGCRELTMGPNALLSLMTGRHTKLGGQSGPQLAILLCFLSGIVEMIMACCNLGVLVDLISMPVTVGFTSATAIIIGCSQLKGLLGITVKSPSDGFIPTIHTVFSNLDNIRYSDAALGFSSLIILLLVRKLKDVKIKGVLGGTFWFVATARNAILVFVASLSAFFAYQAGNTPFILTGTVKSGVPAFQVPPFETSYIKDGNEVSMSFLDMLSELGSSIVLVPIIAVLGNVAISKAFGGSGIDPTRELVALSLTNIFGSFFQSYPATGSFSRSAVNSASGVRTPIGGIYTGSIVLLALGVLTPYFQYIPRAALSAVIISAVIFMIEYEIIPALWRCSRRELLPGAITFILSLWMGVEIGLLAGVAVDVAFLVQRAARPKLLVEKNQTPRCQVEVIVVRPRYSLLYFPAIEYVRAQIGNAMKRYGALPVILDCTNVSEFDYTAARGLGQLSKELSSRKVPFVLLNPSADIKLMLQVNSSSILSATTLDELEPLLLESSPEELRDVVSPLLSTELTKQIPG